MHFDPSKLFAPWLAREQKARKNESTTQQKRRSRAKRDPPKVKIGHGGTLDPLATGVLVTGIGQGTKELSKFLECTKSYDAVVLFGASTDTYDCLGKIVGRKSYQHITEATVRSAMEAFRGKIMQVPPVYSALRVQGKHLYEYAREGKEIPVEIKARPVEVIELEMLEWMEGGTHAFSWPTEEADQADKVVAAKVEEMQATNNLKRRQIDEAGEEDMGTRQAPKRRRNSSSEPGSPIHTKLEADEPQVPPEESKTQTTSRDNTNGTASPPYSQTPIKSETAGLPETTADTSEATPSSEEPIASKIKVESSDENPCQPPAARIRMTVTSGFYVRSLCHDLGQAVGSLAIMSSLVRTRQGQFELGKNVLEYEDLAKGEEVWGPQVAQMLDKWNDGT